jgi:integrase
MSNVLDLIKRNRLPKRQVGQIIESKTAFFVRYYHTTESGERKQKCEKLADKSDLYRSKTDVRPLADRVMQQVNSGQVIPQASDTLAEYFRDVYLPWVEKNRATTTAEGYRKTWNRYLEPHVGTIALANLQTRQVTSLLTHFSEQGIRARTLSHAKWLLSGVYEYAIATGVVTANPVPAAKWLTRPKETDPTVEYTLEQVLAMLRILEPVDLRAAVAVALGFFGSMRPIEIRGLMWADYDGAELHIQRGYHKSIVPLKTKGSNRRIKVIEPLRSLLNKLREQSAGEFILRNGSDKPMDLDYLNTQVIAPALKKAGIAWVGYYAGRRGFSSLMTDTSNNPLNASGHLGHSDMTTTAKHYTKPQRKSINAALEKIEEMATKPAETVQ